ncbi:MAG: YitT family protein, partial [Bacteroidetes bacterium]|nr:YitT family protein [Bacteroidota bacterium]
MRKKRLQWNTPHQLRQMVLIALAVIMASIGLKGFLLPNQFLDGGVTGISLIVSAITGWDLSLLIVLLNVPFVYLGYKQINKYFALKSGIAILSLALLVHFIQIPVVTEDKLLIAVFGGVFLGAGIGFAMRGGGVIDGTEVLAVSVSRKSTLSVGDFITILNVLIFLLAAWVFDLERAMYSMLTYFAAS